MINNPIELCKSNLRFSYTCVRDWLSWGVNDTFKFKFDGRGCSYLKFYFNVMGILQQRKPARPEKKSKQGLFREDNEKQEDPRGM